MFIRCWLLAAGLGLGFAHGAHAAVCTLTLGTPGQLGLSADARVLGSEEGLGAAGTLTVLSLGSNVITVDAPVRTLSPGGYDPVGEVVEVAYAGLGGLALVSQPYISAQSSFAVGVIAASVLTVHNRIINEQGFEAGTYATRTVITCS